MSQRRRKPLSPYLPGGDADAFTPVGYVLEWTPQSHHRHRLDTVDNLRSELLGGEPEGIEQLIVLRGTAAASHADVADALRSLAGVDGGFLDAHAQGRPFRPRGRAKSANWWTWRYPEPQNPSGGGGGDGLVRRASLWLSSPTPVLLVDTPLEVVTREDRRYKVTPRLRHQDAATRRSGLQHGGRYGAVGGTYTAASPPQPHHHHHEKQRQKLAKSIDDELASAMGSAQQVALEEILAELVYERWAACLGALRIGDESAPRLLWGYMVALEHNLDDARCCARNGRFVEHASPAAWTDLAQRAQLRIQLASASSHHHHHHSSSTRHRGASSSQRREQAPGEEPSRVATANERSLDRIAYLGGMLLPVSVVAGILAIEGRYGPEGDQFWVFWATSVAASVAALLIIYLDRLRLAEVWVEMPAGKTGGDGGGGAGAVEAALGGSLGIVEGGGTKVVAAARAWHREQLGWMRAVKQATGYYRLRGARWIRFQSPAVMEEDRNDVVVVEEE